MLDHMFRRRALVYYDNSADQFTFLDTRARKSRIAAAAGEAEIFYSSAWEVSAFIPARGAGAPLGVVSGEILLLEDGKSVEFTERWGVPARSGCRRARAGGFGFAGRDRRDCGARPEHLSEEGVVSRLSRLISTREEWSRRRRL